MTTTALHRPTDEVRRLRRQLAELRQLATALAAAIDHETDRLAWYRDGEAAGYSAGLAAGRAEPRERQDFSEPGGPWPVPVLGPLPRIDPALDRLRYPPDGRRAFSRPRAGDYEGMDRGH